MQLFRVGNIYLELYIPKYGILHTYTKVVNSCFGNEVKRISRNNCQLLSKGVQNILSTEAQIIGYFGVQSFSFDCCQVPIVKAYSLGLQNVIKLVLQYLTIY